MNTPTHIVLLATLALASAAQSAELGRLFFSPSERIRLERQAIKEREADNRTDIPASITVNGIIKRSDGSRIAWINGKPQEIGAYHDPNVVAIPLSGKDRPVEVTVGQRIVVDRQPSEPENATNPQRPSMP